ncbi:pseudouridylate synthase 7 homolog isoform X2 [Bradysia coprophila]|uniref:pseudouridylate synthase 7 homolog isoform X2 n=1 Tax=Bradysia coprophila TaxID=38358 RepID=UPI00187DB51E|nr:pseudouridylate synthase 7 homolog isoform X2 [Bradysia coprophila]
MMKKCFVPLRRMSKINRFCCCIENENSLTFDERDPYVGIEETVGGHPKLNALIKHRMSHFHVNEIDLDGKIVHLTDLNPPSKPADVTPAEPFYVHCTLYKEGVAHPEVLDRLVRKLRIKGDDIGLAGIKDKWGKTSQKISVRNVDPQLLAAFSERNRHVKLGNFTYENHPLKYGDLTGNHFRILLLDVTSPTGSSSISDDIHKAVTSLTHFGFVNYYGRQRFGFEHRSQTIGRAMVQMNWEQVFDLVLRPRKHEPDYMRAAKKLWLSERDPIKIVNSLPPDAGNDKKLMEIWLLHGLAKHYNGGKGDLMEAFKTIPQYMRLLNYAALKSFFWNHLVTYRIRTFGLKPVPGDIVSLRRAATENGDIEPIIAGKKGDLLSDELRVLTDNDFDPNGNCRDYSIHDVVLDAPGSRMTTYTNPKVQSYFETLLKINQLDIDCFARFMERFAEEVHPFDHVRSLRHVVQRPINLTYKIAPYAQQQLRHLDHFIPSELDLLQIHHQHQSRREKKQIAEAQCKQDGKEKTCVILEFSLHKGTYATVALRELLNCTSTWR